MPESSYHEYSALIQVPKINNKQDLVDAVRKRPGMYLSSTGTDGFKNLIYFLFQDLVNYEDDFTIKLEVLDNMRLRCNVGPKIDLQADHGHIMGKKNIYVLAAVCEYVIINDQQISKNGQLIDSDLDISEFLTDHSIIEFSLDPSIFKEFTIPNFQELNLMMRFFGYVYKNVQIHLFDYRNSIPYHSTIHYPDGMIDKLKDIFKENCYYDDKSIDFILCGRFGEYDLELCYKYTYLNFSSYEQHTFANLDRQGENNSLLLGLLYGIRKALRSISKSQHIKLNTSMAEIKSGLCVASIVKSDNLVFGGSTKLNLSMPKLQSLVRDLVAKELLKIWSENPTIQSNFIRKFEIYDYD